MVDYLSRTIVITSISSEVKMEVLYNKKPSPFKSNKKLIKASYSLFQSNLLTMNLIKKQRKQQQGID
jgi:hypothetical protein